MFLGVFARAFFVAIARSVAMLISLVLGLFGASAIRDSSSHLKAFDTINRFRFAAAAGSLTDPGSQLG